MIGTGIAFLWIAGYTNAFNFMGGINGLWIGCIGWCFDRKLE
jgi:UDP-N-acetylmuramyl pentapeptide phosphotransferase/UDP-N-acetylglucosamine-1-phosphate transferase